MPRFACCLTLLVVWIIGAASVPGASAADGNSAAFFQNKVEPILIARCLKCHGSDAEGELDLRSKETLLKGGESGKVVVPGKPGESTLFDYVSEGEMPPDKPLAKAEIAILKKWIAGGAFFPNRILDPFSMTTDHRAGYDWWSLQPVRKPRPPAIRDRASARTPIDRFVIAKLEENGLSLAVPADRTSYIRRVTYDLTGLLPSYDDVKSFVNDSRINAPDRLVDRLLASPAYGERWGRHWLDVVRYAESNGFERDRIRENFWAYRDYVIQAFNDDKPYDEFVRQQLAGDALNSDDPEHLIATGFLVAGPKNDVKTISELERLTTRQDELDEFVVSTCTTFLGLTVGCARCHDHKFDPVTMEDYYGLTSVFSGLDRGDLSIARPETKTRRAAAVAVVQKQIDAIKKQANRLLELARTEIAARRTETKGTLPAVNFVHNEDQFKPVETKFVRITITATSGNAQPCLDEIEVYSAHGKQNIALATSGAIATASSLLPGYKIHQIPHLNDGKGGNAHSWISNERGKGWGQIELPSPSEISRVVWGRDREGKYHDRLPIGYQIETSLDGKTWATVSSSRRRTPFKPGEKAGISPKEAIAVLSEGDRGKYDTLTLELDRLEDALKKIPALPVSYAALDGKPRETFVLHRGNVRKHGDKVGPTALSGVRSLAARLDLGTNDNGPRRRLKLAEWIVNRKNPLTARVLVNRVWHYHFGQGIVNTPSDFGFNGDRPSHPQLLDWLATDFIQHNWQIKRLHRMIVLSAVYRQSAQFRSAAAAVNGSNRLLWRMNPRRIESETLRDAVLQVSGRLDRTMRGPSFRLFRYRDGNVPDYVLLDKPGRETWRRGVYMFNIRTFHPPLMSAFDCPDPSVQTPVRSSSTTSIQALSLMNNRFMLDQARAFSNRIEQTAGDNFESQTRTAYRLVYQRDPTADEISAAAAFIRRQGLFSLCRVLLNTNEFLYVY